MKLLFGIVIILFYFDVFNVVKGSVFKVFFWVLEVNGDILLFGMD